MRRYLRLTLVPLSFAAALCGTLNGAPEPKAVNPAAKHWAFAAPKRPPLPAVKNTAWAGTPIDRFILARIEAEGLRPSTQASKTSLLRRVTFDLTGLPPTPDEVTAFLADESPNAYEKVVDRLLASPRFGEHQARYWLDAARFGDTHGLHLDNYREIWPYRDWVIRAFNGNMPFDQFVLKQLAGDLLNESTVDDQVATGFLRCHVTTSEGGSIEEEVYVRNVTDNVDTIGTVFLGLTVGCSRCHDHKFDPLTMKDYYQLFAFFNSIDGSPLDGNAAKHAPVARIGSKEQLAAIESLNRQIDSLQQKISTTSRKISIEEPVGSKEPPKPKRAEIVWVDDALPTNSRAIVDGRVNAAWKFVAKPSPVFSGEKSIQHSSDGLGQVVVEGINPAYKVGTGDTLFAHVYLDPQNLPKEIMLQWHSTGWLHRAYWGDNRIEWGRDGSTERHPMGKLPESGKWVRLEVKATDVGLKPGAAISGFAMTSFGGNLHWDKAGMVTMTPQGDQSFETLSAWLQFLKSTKNAGLPKAIQDIIKLDAAKRSAEQSHAIRDYFVERVYAKTRPIFEPMLRDLKALEQERSRLEQALPTSLVFKERKDPRPAYVLKRGEYDRRAGQVDRATPAFLPPLAGDAPKNRLGLATWLISAENPLLARTTVNRLWQQIFGIGFVKTAEDLGTQGETPSHRELLDWLAVEFRESQWDVKRLLKLIVTSNTYRQSSVVSADRLAKDPANRLLSRGPRFRLDAEMVRDQALFVSGLLIEQVGGPSGKPPQPTGLWEAVGYTSSNTAKFVADSAPEKTHRRSLYTFWKRTSAPPQMTALDAPSREFCVVRRERTNTPLQALLLMNETQFVECSRGLASRAIRSDSESPPNRIRFMFLAAVGREPDAAELAELLAVYRDQRTVFAKNENAARKLAGNSTGKTDTPIPVGDRAAYTMTANLILNLDEVLTKE
jgi:hypothetical protein